MTASFRSAIPPHNFTISSATCLVTLFFFFFHLGYFFFLAKAAGVRYIANMLQFSEETKVRDARPSVTPKNSSLTVLLRLGAHLQGH